jgi:hypothetical protein
MKNNILEYLYLQSVSAAASSSRNLQLKQIKNLAKIPLYGCCNRRSNLCAEGGVSGSAHDLG